MCCSVSPSLIKGGSESAARFSTRAKDVASVLLGSQEFRETDRG